MERLLSCYRDKMVTSKHWSLPSFRRHVVETARKILNERKLQQQIADNQNFIQRKLLSVPVQNYYGNPLKLNPGQNNQRLNYAAQNLQYGNPATQRLVQPQQTMPPQNQNIDTLPNVVPTFEEFLEYILSTDLKGRGYDSHWVPYWRYCSPCHVSYHLIGKLETANEDLKYVWQKTGLGTKVPIPWINSHKRSSKDEEIERQFYSSLPRDLILRFYQKFKLDYEMFGYSINDVLVKAGYQPIQEEQF